MGYAEVAPAAQTTLKAWRGENRGPTYVKIEGQVFYPSDALDAYIEARLVQPGAR